MASKVKYLLDSLRLMKVVGSTRNSDVGHLMYQSEDTLLLHYQSTKISYSAWILIRRTSRQYYRVFAMMSRFDQDFVIKESFITVDSTCQWIKENIFRRY